MDTISLKKYIFENGKVENVLREIGCHSITYHPSKDFFSCGNYNGDNKGAINVKNNEYLNVINWTREKEFGDNSDIITLVQYNKSMSFVEAVKYLHKILDLPFEFKKKQEKVEKKYDPLSVFKKVLKCNRRVVNVDDIHILDDNLLTDFVPMLHIDFLRDGIMPWTREKFGLCYSYRKKRMIIPHRHWLTGQVIGMNMRTMVPNYELLGIPKYLLTEGFSKQLNLYGLWENYDSIQKAGYVVVYESERSVLKRDSLNDSTGVAISGHSLSQEQIAILIGLNVDIIISMDKDVPIEEIRHMCSKFFNIRNVYYTYDKYDLLGEKDSIADASNKVFNFLIKHKVKYDDDERKEYLNSLKEKRI